MPCFTHQNIHFLIKQICDFQFYLLFEFPLCIFFNLMQKWFFTHKLNRRPLFAWFAIFFCYSFILILLSHYFWLINHILLNKTAFMRLITQTADGYFCLFSCYFLLKKEMKKEKKIFQTFMIMINVLFRDIRLEAYCEHLH